MVIAMVALFVALGGVSYGLAKGSIDGREIKNKTITFKDIKPNKVGGKSIKESTLGTVPSADVVDGHQFARIDYRVPQNTEAQQILNLGGLIITAACGPQGALTVNAGSAVHDAMVHIGNVTAGGTARYGQDNDLDIGETVGVLPGPENTAAEGTLTYLAPDGRIVTAQYMAQERATNCVFVGKAAVS
jgi:hypothetical protein